MAKVDDGKGLDSNDLVSCMQPIGMLLNSRMNIEYTDNLDALKKRVAILEAKAEEKGNGIVVIPTTTEIQMYS